MTDQKLIAGIFNDFLGLYTGKIQTGIRPLIEKYKNHRAGCSLQEAVEYYVSQQERRTLD